MTTQCRYIVKRRMGFFLSVVVTIVVYSGVAVHAANDSKIERELRKLDDERVEALVGGDIATLERFFADDLIWTHGTCQVQTKAEFIADLRSGKRAYKSIKDSDIQVRVHGRMGIVTGQTDYRLAYGAQEVDISLRFTEVFYENPNGQWQMVAWHSTQLPK